MVELIIATNTALRIQKRNTLLGSRRDVIVLDDMTARITHLEEYAYPSLFSLETPVVHAKFLLETSSMELTKDLLQTLVASPTQFVLEERTVGSPVVKLIEKAGGVIYEEKEFKTPPKPNTIFGVTSAITAGAKKDRWIAYQRARADHAPEALIGILYWKLRQLLESPMDKNSEKNASYKALYKALMHVQRDAWQRGFPLDLAIEKVILGSQ
jgi:hypothetical protein